MVVETVVALTVAWGKMVMLVVVLIAGQPLLLIVEYVTAYVPASLTEVAMAPVLLLRARPVGEEENCPPEKLFVPVMVALTMPSELQYDV